METLHLLLTLNPSSPIAPPVLVPLGLAGFILPLCTNFMVTSLIVYRIWRVSSNSRPYVVSNTSGNSTFLQRATMIVIESGALYFAIQFVFVVLFGLNHPAQAIVVPMAVQVYVRLPDPICTDRNI